jgi:hypothetical protein
MSPAALARVGQPTRKRRRLLTERGEEVLGLLSIVAAVLAILVLP